MANNQFAELHQYYSDFVNQFYSQGFLTPSELELFERQEDFLARRKKDVRRAGLAEGAARGLLRTGQAFESIMAPRMQAVEEAYASLDFERQRIEEGRRQQAFSMAMQAMKEDEERRARGGGLLGSIFGTALGVGASFIPGIGPIVGPALGGITSNLLAGGPSPLGNLGQMSAFLNMSQGEGSFGEFLQWISGGGGGSQTTPYGPSPAWFGGGGGT